MSKKGTRKKKPFTNWDDADQGKAFKKSFDTMSKEFDQATEDFETVGPTQKKAFTPGQKVTMGKIDSRTTNRKRRRK